MNEDNLFLRTIRYVDQHPGSTWRKIKEDLKLTEQEKWAIQQEIRLKDIFIIKDVGEIANYYLGLDSTFNLLEYEELKEARQSAKQAKKYAIFAIILSAILAIASIIIDIVK